MGVVALLASLVLCLVGLTGTANAADSDSNTETVTGSGSITVDYQHGSTPVADVELKLYQVATWDKDWNAQATEDFKNAPVTWPELNTSEDLRVLANTLDSYIAQQKISPLQTGKTATDGTYVFNQLPDGLYLITYGSYANGDTTCKAGAMLVSLPSKTNLDDTDKGINITVNPKTECETKPITPPVPPDNHEDITVNKVWKDDNNADGKRPSKVIVQLIKDGVVVDEVELNESNGWKHTWTDLDKDHTWQVIEKTVPDGYTMSIDREGSTITIVNEYEKDDTCEGDDCEDKENPPVVNPPDNKHDTTADTGAAIAGVALIAVALLGIGLAVRIAVRRRQS